MTYKKKLIEVALPLAKINRESARQKTMGAAPHYQNLHRWWARRPAAAARAVLWASLVDDPSSNPDEFPTQELQAIERSRLFDILEQLVPWSASFDEKILGAARAEILKSSNGILPKVLDPFGGGGSIPMEAIRLGVPTYTGDLNPVAVLIQRAMLEIPNRFRNVPPIFPGAAAERSVWSGLDGLQEDVISYGRWVEDEARKLIGKHYPNVSLPGGEKVAPVLWIWARTVNSPDPSWKGSVPLVKSWVVSKKNPTEPVWIEPVLDRNTFSIKYEIRFGGTPIKESVSRQGFTCIATGASIPYSYIRDEAQEGRLGSELIAVVCEGERGKIFLGPSTENEFNIEIEIPEFLQGSPQGKAANDVYKYGMTSWGKIFTDRQLLALTTFSKLIKEVRVKVENDASALVSDNTRLSDGGKGRSAYADAVVTYLALTLDRCADYWSSICTWHVSNQQLRETFARQAIPMSWDFAEVNPFSKKMGSWDSMLKTNNRAIGALYPDGFADVKQRDARARIEEVGNCVISTDPPYYDNISYSDLSDFFYVWLRENLKDIWPDECATLLTPKVDELIADSRRSGSKQAANLHFEYGIQGVFSKAAENCDERYPATIFYAFKASESEEKGNVSTGWETFLSGLLSSGFTVTATWPIRTELANKIGVNAGDNMLATSIVLACRKRSTFAGMVTRGEFIAALRAEMAPAIKILQAENIAPVDMAQSAIGPGIGIFSRYLKVVEADGQQMTVRMALSIINEILAEVLSGEESELDADTRFAVTWFEQFGNQSGSYGEADTLAKAKNTTVNGVVDSGIVASKDGKVRLLERNELDESWDPINDARLTVWETTHHLIRALEDSESAAADLLRKIGNGYGEKARQLAYLLYGICDRKKWASEGGAYNMLIAAWPEIVKLASKEYEGHTDSETLF